MIKFLRSIFLNKKLALDSVMMDLLMLKEELLQVEKMDDKLDAIVRFFQLTSAWHDRGLCSEIRRFEISNFNGKFAKELGVLNKLSSALSSSGRSRFGMNRTVYGEEVTDECVFLGDICGLNTQTIWYWRKQKHETKGGWGFTGMEKMSSYDVVVDQAKNYMSANISYINSLIETLENLYHTK